MRVRQLNEASSDPLPKKFWLVFDIPTYSSSDERQQARIDGMLNDIASGELHGVKGISDSREIITNWFMIARNAAVVMDAEKVADLNDIEQIRYNDPDWLCRNNFAALYRIWDKTGGGKYRHSGMMYNLAAYMIQSMPRSEAHSHQFEYYGVATKLGDQWQKVEDSVTINSVDDAAKLFSDLFAQVQQEYNLGQFDRIDWRGALIAGLKRVSKVYGSEGEWLVKTPSLRIPPKSIMLIAVHKDILDQYDEWVNSKDEFKWYASKYAFEHHEKLIRFVELSNLRDRYDIRFIDGKKFDSLRPKVMSRRSSLSEAFDAVQRFSWVDNSNEDMSLLQASFQIDDGLFVVQFKNLYYNPGFWDMTFVRNGELEITNTGSAQKVLATVMKAAREFIAAKHPHHLAIAAKNDEVSRTKLYPKLIAMMQRDFPQYVGAPPKKMRSHTEYRFSREPVTESILNELWDRETSFKWVSKDKDAWIAHIPHEGKVYTLAIENDNGVAVVSMGKVGRFWMWLDRILSGGSGIPSMGGVGSGSSKDAIKIFGSVIGAVQDFMETARPHAIMFSGLTSAHSKLYSAMIRKMQSVIQENGYTSSVQFGNFILRREDAA